MLTQELQPDTFQQFQEIIYTNSGINLAPSKAGLIRTRIGKHDAN